MYAANDIIGCQSTWQQELRLPAALLQGKNARSAWEKWKASTDVELSDRGMAHNLFCHCYRHNLSPLWQQRLR